MQCRKPILLPKVGYVPCGKCTSCRIAKSREWTLRILSELPFHQTAYFVTLTYSDENLPLDSSLKISDFQKFMKRLRKDHTQKLMYFGCGEYGDLTCRPHYHAIIFDVIDKGMYYDTSLRSYRLPVVDENWKLGHTTAGTVTRDSVLYVTGYIMKKYNGKMAEEIYKGNESPFAVMSKGIGRTFYEKHKDEIFKLGYIPYDDGLNLSIPRYYLSRLEKDGYDVEELKERCKLKSSEVLEFFRERFDDTHGGVVAVRDRSGRYRNYVCDWFDYLRHKDDTLKSKKNLRSKGKL